MNNKCLDCNKSIDKRAKRCMSCAVKNIWKDRPKKEIRKYYCKDCDKEIHRKSVRCSSCAKLGKNLSIKTLKKFSKNRKGKKCHLYIDGRANKQYYCIDCGKDICWQTACYGQKRCHHCANTILMNDPKILEKLSKSRTVHGLGYLPYSKEFTKTLKKQIRLRDNFTCQYCGMTQKEHFKKYGRDIEIHHIDYNKFNCDENNLITTCKICNSRANFNRDYYHAYFSYINKRQILCQINK